MPKMGKMSMPRIRRGGGHGSGSGADTHGHGQAAASPSDDNGGDGNVVVDTGAGIRGIMTAQLERRVRRTVEKMEDESKPIDVKSRRLALTTTAKRGDAMNLQQYVGGKWVAYISLF